MRFVSKKNIVLVFASVLLVGWFLGEDPDRSPTDEKLSLSESAEFRIKSTLTKVGADTTKIMKFLYKNTEPAKPYSKWQERPPTSLSEFATDKNEKPRMKYNPAPLPNTPGDPIKMEAVGF